MNHSFGKISGSLLLLAMLAAPIFANDFWHSPPKKETRIGDGLGNILSGGGDLSGAIIWKDKSYLKNENGPDDIFQCYAPDSSGICRPNGHYASTSKLPVVGEIKPLEKDIKCHRYKDEIYIAIETSIPEQTTEYEIHYPSKTKCFRNSQRCQESISDTANLEKEKPQHYFCKNTETTQEGCRVSEKGILFTYNKMGAKLRRTYEALLLYLTLKTENNVSKFMETIEQEHLRDEFYRITLPWKFSDDDVNKHIEASIRKSKGMEFFDALKKSGRINANFSSMQDVIKTCSEWAFKDSNKVGGKK